MNDTADRQTQRPDGKAGGRTSPTSGSDYGEAMQDLYATRFPAEDRRSKDAVWAVLCHDFFQRYIPADGVVLDLGAGFCEFLRHIRCRRRIAVDLNPAVRDHAPAGAEVLMEACDRLTSVGDTSVDVVFASNFFEHLPDKRTFLRTVEEVRRVLKRGGKLLVLQPNIRVVNGRYWDFVDHLIPLTDRAVAEALELAGLSVVECRARFLPYTTRSRWPQSPWLVRLYLRVPWVWRFLGGQAWIVGVKP